MQIRPGQLEDLDLLVEIDATIQSTRYLHLSREGEGLQLAWQFEERPLREKLIAPNPLSDDKAFTLKQILSGIEEGQVLIAEHDDVPIGLAFAQPRAEQSVLHVHDVRIDFDYRRKGIGMAMMFQLIGSAREQGLRAVTTQTRTNNHPACQFFARAGFELAGIDTHFHSNHDLVKEAVTLFWYAPLD